MSTAEIRLVGNLIADPELRFTPNGTALAKFRVACTERRLDAESNTWVDGDTLFMDCTVWRSMAEHVAESLSKGVRVVVTGRLRSHEYETTEGEKRRAYEVVVDDVAPSLRNATATVKRVTREDAPESSGRRVRAVS